MSEFLAQLDQQSPVSLFSSQPTDTYRPASCRGGGGVCDCMASLVMSLTPYRRPSGGYGEAIITDTESGEWCGESEMDDE